MNKKHTIKKAAALILALGLTFGATGCDFLVTDNEKDLSQEVAIVNIADTLENDVAFGRAVADSISDMVEGKEIPSTILKRDLIASFINQGYSYVQSGSSYKDTFETLMDGLANQKILTQYATAHFIKKAVDNPVLVTVPFDEYKTQELAAVDNTRAEALLNAHPEILRMKYYLTDYGKADSINEYYKVEYSVRQSLNNTLDSAEAQFISEEDGAHTHEESRTKPTNVDALQTDYLPIADGGLNYDVYTGRNALSDCGEYKKVKGSTSSTRMRAYNTFLANLQGYGLVQTGEDLANATLLDYYYIELSSALENALVSKYYEELQDGAASYLDEAKLIEEYETLRDNQQISYQADYTAFETAMDGVSDKSFLLYGLPNYGYVYNILIPFTEAQNQDYTAAKKEFEKEALFDYRNELLSQVVAKDLRDSWFCEEAEDHYAYAVTDGYYDNGADKGENTYLFFENNASSNDKYKKLTHYKGNYPYNGTVTKTDGEWDFTPNRLAVAADGEKSPFILEFENYIKDSASANVVGWKNSTYGQNYYSDALKEEVDYRSFVYYEGYVDLDGDGTQANDVNAADFFNTNSTSYKALSAVNELMFAYSTDTGCLNTYMGYVVSPYKTQFVSEFEYASQKVVENGVGSYAIVPSDYGWHIIYCSYKFTGGEVYDGFSYADATGDNKVEGSFSNLFYEALKSTSATSQSSAKRAEILARYDGSVTLYTDAYSDLLEM